MQGCQDHPAKIDISCPEPPLTVAALRSRVAKLEAALRPFAKYARARAAQPLRGLGDTIHLIHPGSPHEAELTLTDCNAALAALEI